jgi:hypothetical protein
MLDLIDNRVKLYLLGFVVYGVYKYFKNAFQNIHLGPYIDGPCKDKI